MFSRVSNPEPRGLLCHAGHNAGKGPAPWEWEGKASLKATVVGQREARGQEPAPLKACPFPPRKVSTAGCFKDISKGQAMVMGET